jgi:hypothetical protein
MPEGQTVPNRLSALAAAAAGDVRPALSAGIMQTSTFSGQAGPSMSVGSALPGQTDGEVDGMEGAEHEEGYMAHAHGGGAGPILADAGEYDGGRAASPYTWLWVLVLLCDAQ